MRTAIVHKLKVHDSVFFLDFTEDIALVCGGKREFFRDHVVEHDSAGPDIYSVVVAFLIQHFGGEVGRRTTAFGY